MEIGDIFVNKIKQKIQKGDLDVRTSAGFIMSDRFGTLINLRHELQERFGRRLIYFTISGEPLYVVHLNDLSEKKQEELRQRRNAKRLGNKSPTKRKDA